MCFTPYCQYSSHITAEANTILTSETSKGMLWRWRKILSTTFLIDLCRIMSTYMHVYIKGGTWEKDDYHFISAISKSHTWKLFDNQEDTRAQHIRNIFWDMLILSNSELNPVPSFIWYNIMELRVDTRLVIFYSFFIIYQLIWNLIFVFKFQICAWFISEPQMKEEQKKNPL